MPFVQKAPKNICNAKDQHTQYIVTVFSVGRHYCTFPAMPQDITINNKMNHNRYDSYN